MDNENGKIWKIRTVKEYTDAHNHILVGRVLAITDSYVRLHCRSYHFGKNERIHTENSYKYSLEAIEGIAQRVGLKIIEQWFDDRRYFTVTLFNPEKVHGKSLESL